MQDFNYFYAIEKVRSVHFLAFKIILIFSLIKSIRYSHTEQIFILDAF